MILSWNFAYNFDYLYYSSSSSVVNLCQFVYARLQTGRIMALWCPSGSPSVRPSQFSGLLSYMLWCIELFLIMKIRSSSSFVNFRRLFFLLCPVWNLEYWKYTVFCVFPWHALTYWAEICILVLFCFTVLQIKFECRKFASILWELCPFWNLEYWNSQFFVLFSYMLWHNELKFYIDLVFYCTTDQSLSFVNLCQFVWGAMPLLEHRILEIQFSVLFSYTLWHIELKFCTWLFLLHYTSQLNDVNLRQFLWELCPFWN